MHTWLKIKAIKKIINYYSGRSFCKMRVNIFENLFLITQMISIILLIVQFVMDSSINKKVGIISCINKYRILCKYNDQAIFTTHINRAGYQDGR